MDTRGREGWKRDEQRAKSGSADPDMASAHPQGAQEQSSLQRWARSLYPPVDNQSLDAGCPQMADGCSRTHPCSRGHQRFIDGDPG